MTDYARLEQQLAAALRLTRRAVAISTRDAVPDGVTPFSGTLPSGCSFWKLAAEGRTFSTAPVDHHNCPIGSYTHNIALPPERQPELMQTLTSMADIGYIRMEEVGAIPRLPEAPGTVIYAPLGETPVDPDVVLITGTPGRLMLLHEAATRAGSTVQPLFGRPTCMAVPAALGDAVVSSMACIGNRIYTDLADGEMYTAIPGSRLEGIVAQLETTVRANAALASYHTDRRARLTA